MAVRVRADGAIVCAAMHPLAPGDVYLDDPLHYLLSAEAKVLVTEPMNDGGRGGHASHGAWWWRGAVPADATIDGFYLE